MPTRYFESMQLPMHVVCEDADGRLWIVGVSGFGLEWSGRTPFGGYREYLRELPGYLVPGVIR